MLTQLDDPPPTPPPGSQGTHWKQDAHGNWYIQRNPHYPHRTDQQNRHAITMPQLGDAWLYALDQAERDEYDAIAAGYGAARPDRSIPSLSGWRLFAEQMEARLQGSAPWGNPDEYNEGDYPASAEIVALDSATQEVSIKWTYYGGPYGSGSICFAYMIDPARQDTDSERRSTRMVGYIVIDDDEETEFTLTAPTPWPIEAGVEYHYLARAHAGTTGLRNDDLTATAT